MGRNKRQSIVNVGAQASQAVGQQQSDNGNRGGSSDLDAPQTRPRHSRGGELHRAQGTTSSRRSYNRPDGSIQSLPRDGVVDTNSTSVMPPPSQRRLYRSATAPLEERRRCSLDDDDREQERLALVRRHSERLESPTRAGRHRHRSHSVTETETETDEESEPSKESDYSGYNHNVLELSEMVEEADDEAPTHRRRRSNGKDAARRRIPGHSSSRARDSTHSNSDEEPNHHRELVVRDDPSFSRQSDHELEQCSTPQLRSQRKPARASGGPRMGDSSHRAPRRTEQNTRAAPETPRSPKTSTVTSSRSSSASVRRPTNVLSGFFKAPPPPRKQSKHAASDLIAKGGPSHTERVECVICLSDVSIRKAAHLKCDHHMCNACLKRAFVLSVEDSTHMPPKCCTKDHIQPKHVERLFDLPFKKMWNRKFVEYTTKNRLYCPAKRCGHFIKPSRIKVEKGRKYARCGHCDTKVCAKCNNRWHKTVDCPQDQTINDFLTQAKAEGWQRCYKCRAMVELREGCNHMTCRCGAEFCMICGTKWKGCDCPWFNDEAVAADRFRHMNEVPPPRGAIHDIFHHEGPPMPPELQGMPGFGEAPLPMRPVPYGYQDGSRVDVRRMHEQDEADMAQRMAAYENLDGGYPSGAYDMRGGPTVIGAGNPTAHHINYPYHQRSPSTMGASAPPLSVPYDRSSVADYVSEVSRARGVREDSLDRRLAERLAERPAAPQASMHPPGCSPMGHFTPTPPVYSYAGSPSSIGVYPTAGVPMLVQSYPYSTPPVPMDTRYSAMQSSPSQLSTPGHGCYEQKRVEVNTPRRRRRAQERERAAEAERGRLSSSSSSSAITATTTEVRTSSLAGLTGPGRGMDRVAEWSYHVTPGIPTSIVGDGR